MTRHPDALDKINYVKEFIVDPCDAPFQVYAKTFRSAALKLVISYFALDMVQIFTGYARPHGSLRRPRASGHRRSKKPRGKPRTWLGKAGRWLSWDPYDDLGRHLPGGDDLAARRVHHGVHTLWSVYDHMQKIAYWVMVFNLTVDFFYDWASGVKESKYCQEQERGWLHARGDKQIQSSPTTRRPVNMPIIDKMRGPVYWAGLGGHCQARSWTCVFSGGIEWPADGIRQPVRFVVLAAGAGGDHFSGDEPDENGNLSIAFEARTGAGINVFTEGGGTYFVTNPSITIICNH